jgi:type IV secretory pathway VirB6-like protein
MKLAKKITQIFSLIALIAFASSCKPQCYSNDEFDVNSVVIDSYPTSDNIVGSYDPETGGQVVDWHNTGLKSNGDMFLIKISGAWTSWGGGTYNDSTESILEALPACNTCAKIDSNTPNCICYSNQTPQSEFLQTCDSSDPDQQNNPNLCTCTKDPNFGTALDYGVYHFPLNYYTKNETPQIADKQSECKFNRGMGAYIALFGRSGVTDPMRAYHLFTDDKDAKGEPTAVCDISKNTNGECRDSSGRDRTSYVFRSANDRIFMKDDGEGNTGNNRDTSDDVYHGPNEVVKLKIYDQYYNDNYGKYNVDILRGVGDNGDSSAVGILEFMVRLVENVLLGDLKPTKTTKQINGEDVTTTEYIRQGGIIEVMYKGIVQDSVFIRVLQITLILYVAFYGLATLMGIAEINKKELMSRLVKISLVIFFTNQSSWYWYNKLVVGLFYDSMNYVVSLFMSLSDYALSERIDTSALLVAQMDRSVDISNATRFSYIDNMIKVMLSTAFAAKVFSLLFSDILGILYIYLIYRILVFNFLKTMVHAATLYLTNMMQIIFVLCLGPIFIAFSLFAHTKNMFQNWLSFLGSRSLEIILIFAILYNFVMLIDLWIRDLLDYSACVEPLSFGGANRTLSNLGLGGLFSINVLQASGIGDRNLVVWLTKIAKIAALIFITKLILDKVMAVAGSLISIGGMANKNGSSMAGDLAGGLTGMADKMAKAADPTADRAKSLGGMVGGLGSKIIGANMGGLNPLKSSLNPVKAGREAARNSLLDASINQAKKDVAGMKGADGKPLSGLDAAKAIRDQVAKKYGGELSKTAAALGVTPERAAARVDQLFAKQLANDLKSKGVMGSDLSNQLRSGLQAYADKIHPKNNTAGKDANKAMMDALGKTIASESKLSGKEAAKLYADKPDLQNKYAQHLQDESFKRQSRQEKMGTLSRLASKAIDGMDRVRGLNPEKRNPEAAQQAFLRNLKNNQKENPSLLDRLNPANKSNTLNRMSDWISGREGSLDARTDKSQTDLLRANLAQDQKSKPLAALRKGASEREKAAHAAALKKLDATADKKRSFYQEQLRNLATKDLAKDIGKINQLQKKGRFSDATKLKKDLLKKEQDSLKKNDGRTLFEKASRLDYLHKQFGIAGEDPTKILSKALNKSAKDLASDIQQKMDNGAKTSSLINEVGDLKDLRSGLFSTTPNKALDSALNDLTKNQVPEFGTPILEDKQSKINGDIELNNDKKDTQHTLDDLVKSIGENGEKERKEAEDERKKDFENRTSETFQMLQEIAKMKVEGKDEEVKVAMENLKTKIADDSKAIEERREKDIKEFEKTFAAFEKLENKNSKEVLAIAHNLSESLDAFVKPPALTEKELAEKIKATQDNAAANSTIPGLQAPDLGLTAPDLGLTAPDLGLKASNFLLGVPEEKSKINEAQLKELGMLKRQLDGQLKINGMNKKIKEFELAQLENNPENSGKIASLKSQISDLEKEISHLEKENGSIEDRLKE